MDTTSISLTAALGSVAIAFLSYVTGRMQGARRSGATEGELRETVLQLRKELDEAWKHINTIRDMYVKHAELERIERQIEEVRKIVQDQFKEIVYAIGCNNREKQHLLGE